jgi:SAM-dependent methyltransferase
MTSGFGPPPWWRSLYDDLVAELFLVRRDPHELEEVVAFLATRLALHAGSLVFDQCCGIGSLSLPLARRGVRVFGVDQCPDYVDRANRDAAGLSVSCRFEAGDAFEYVPPEPCDAVFNWGTGFGNDAEDARNLSMLRRAFDGLKPGGRFLLDYQNVPRVLRDFQHALTHRLKIDSGEVLVVRESTVDLGAGALRQRWTFVMPDGRQWERHSLIHLYLPHELAALLNRSGFVDVEFSGGVHGEPLDLDSPRCILAARRP